MLGELVISKYQQTREIKGNNIYIQTYLVTRWKVTDRETVLEIILFDDPSKKLSSIGNVRVVGILYFYVNIMTK